jgi:hypothetical protein
MAVSFKCLPLQGKRTTCHVYGGASGGGCSTIASVAAEPHRVSRCVSLLLEACAALRLNWSEFAATLTPI